MPRWVRPFTTRMRRASRKKRAISQINSTSDDLSRIVPPSYPPVNKDTPGNPPIEIGVTETESIQLAPKSAPNVNSIVELLNWLETCGTIIITEDDADLIRTKIYRFFSEYKEGPHRYAPSEINEARKPRVRLTRVTSTHINSRQTRATYKRSRGDQELKNRVNLEKEVDNCASTEFEKVNIEEKSEDLNKESSFFSYYPEIKDEPEDAEGTISAEEFHTSADISTEEQTQENEDSIWVPVWVSPTVPACADKSHIPLTETSNPKVYCVVKCRPPFQRSTSNLSKILGKRAKSIDSGKSDEVLVSEESMANSVIPDDGDSGGESKGSNSCNLYSENQDKTSYTELVKEMCLEDCPQESAISIPLPRGIESPRLPSPDPWVIDPKPLPAPRNRRRRKLEKLLKPKMVPPYKCDECGKVLRTIPNLKIHKETHLNLRNYLCQMCGKSFNQKSSLNIHMKAHIGVKKYLCDKCPKTFLHSSTLACHQRTHSVEKLAECPVCNKLLRDRDSLREHSKLHSEERPFKCTLCPKTFRRPDHLRAHVRIHTGDKRYKCEPCGKGFVQIGSLIFHNRTHHGIVKKKVN